MAVYFLCKAISTIGLGESRKGFISLVRSFVAAIGAEGNEYPATAERVGGARAGVVGRHRASARADGLAAGRCVASEPLRVHGRRSRHSQNKSRRKPKPLRRRSRKRSRQRRWLRRRTRRKRRPRRVQSKRICEKSGVRVDCSLPRSIHAHIARTTAVIPLWQRDVYIAFNDPLGGVNSIRTCYFATSNIGSRARHSREGAWRSRITESAPKAGGWPCV